MKESFFLAEFALPRMLFRLALAVGLILLCVEIAALARINLANNFVLIGISTIPVIGLLGSEEVLEWTATRTNRRVYGLSPTLKAWVFPEEHKRPWERGFLEFDDAELQVQKGLVEMFDVVENSEEISRNLEL